MRVKVPSYRRHAKGYGFVTVNGKNFYFGKYEDPQSKLNYDMFIAEWLANGRSLTKPETQESSDISVNRLLELFWIHAQGKYTKNGRATSQLTNIRLAIRAAREAYGETAARDFGAVQLRRVRERILGEQRLCRSEVSRRCRLIVQVFKWGVSWGHIPPTVTESLRTVEGLRRGDTSAGDHPRKKPVSWEAVEATLPFLSAQCRAMVLMQWFTGMRPGEIVIMRGCDIDENWDYRPHSHKTEHHDFQRLVYLPPMAREILQPWLAGRLPTDYLFSSREAMLAARPVSKTRSRPKRNPKKVPGDHYSSASYYHAVQAACVKAAVEPWHPHRLRHAFLTRCEAQLGIEVARVQAGHSRCSMTEHYVSHDRRIARRALDEMT
jgi:integrase